MKTAMNNHNHTQDTFQSGKTNTRFSSNSNIRTIGNIDTTNGMSGMTNGTKMLNSKSGSGNSNECNGKTYKGKGQPHKGFSWQEKTLLA